VKKRYYGPLLSVALKLAPFLALTALLALPFVFKETFFMLLGVAFFIYLIVNLAYVAYLERSL